MKRQALKIVSVFMFVVFLSGIMPKEYIHDAIFDHDDDVHPIYKKGEMVFTKKHNHCSFLSFEFAPFVTPSVNFITYQEQSCYTVYVQSIHDEYCFSPYIQIASRGPPAFARIS